jgi:hypothetical protein
MRRQHRQVNRPKGRTADGRRKWKWGKYSDPRLRRPDDKRKPVGVNIYTSLWKQVRRYCDKNRVFYTDFIHEALVRELERRGQRERIETNRPLPVVRPEDL